MWTSRSRSGGRPAELDDESDSILDARSAVNFPVAFPVARLQPLRLPWSHHKDHQPPPAPPNLPARSAVRLAVDRNAHRKGASLGQRAPRAAYRLWPGGATASPIADSDSTPSMSMPPDQMSLSTVTDSTISDRLPVQPSPLNVRAEPINDTERHALNRMAMTDKPNPADFDTIIHDILQLDLKNEEVEHLMTQIYLFGPNIAHVREREFLTALNRVPDDVPDVGPNSPAQLRSERLEPVTMAETLRTPTSPKLDLDMDSQYRQQDQPRVDAANERPSKFPSTAVLPFGPSRADGINSRPTSPSSADIQEQPNSPQLVACSQPATTLSSQQENSRLPNDSQCPTLDDGEIKVVSSEPATLESGSRAPPEQVTLLSQEYSAGPGWVQESDDESDHQSLSSGYFSDHCITDIGNYGAKQVFGDDFENTISRSVLDEAVQCFIDALMLGRIDSPPHSVGLSDGNQAQSGSSSTTHSGFGEASSLKRKAAGHNGFRQGYRGTQRDDNDDGDDDDIGRRQNRRGNGGDRSTGETGNESGRSPTDRLEFMCPFRLKDRFRFDVRDWHECATKAYICEGKKNELNELRRHLQTKHARPGAPSDPYCSRCKAEFATVALLDEHAKEECIYRELFTSDDPLDGLTADAIRVLTNRKGRQGHSPVAQYQEICHIALGKDFEVPGPGYLPVIEHFELHQQYLDSLPALRHAFQQTLPVNFVQELDSLIEQVHIHTIDVFGQCRPRAPLTGAAISKRRKTTRGHKPWKPTPSASPGDDDAAPVPRLPLASTPATGKPLCPLLQRPPQNLQEPHGTESGVERGLTGNQPQLSSVSSPRSSNDMQQQSLWFSSALFPAGYSSLSLEGTARLEPQQVALKTAANEVDQNGFQDSWRVPFARTSDKANQIAVLTAAGQWSRIQDHQSSDITLQEVDQAIFDDFTSWVEEYGLKQNNNE